MELRAYWRIVARRWWLPVGLALLVGALTLADAAPVAGAAGELHREHAVQRGHQARTHPRRLHVRPLLHDAHVGIPGGRPGEIVRSQAFAAAVSERLADQGIVVPAGAIGASTQPGKLHRILTVNVNWPNQEQIGADR